MKRIIRFMFMRNFGSEMNGKSFSFDSFEISVFFITKLIPMSLFSRPLVEGLFFIQNYVSHSYFGIPIRA